MRCTFFRNYQQSLLLLLLLLLQIDKLSAQNSAIVPYAATTTTAATIPVQFEMSVQTNIKYYARGRPTEINNIK